ncbi:hypothetical protein Kisp02_22690 [Kineosporia sp. NBRC 101731]|nr:hypothetical protein Kisp02_22690 [Kineosporia sp. NBRC 101731]
MHGVQIDGRLFPQLTPGRSDEFLAIMAEEPTRQRLLSHHRLDPSLDQQQTQVGPAQGENEQVNSNQD